MSRLDEIRAKWARAIAEGGVWKEYGPTLNAEDFGLVAAAPEDVAYLLGEVESLRAVLEAARQEHRAGCASSALADAIAAHDNGGDGET